VAFRGLGRTQPQKQLRQPFILKQLEQVNKVVSCELSISSVNYMDPQDFQLPKGSIKKRYMKKFPLIRTAEDGTTTVEGVSNKQIPCPVPWREPQQVERFMPGEHGSGDLGNVQSLVDESHLEKSQPRLDYESSKELLKSPVEVKRVLSLEFGRNKDIVSKIRHELILKVQEHPLDVSSLPVNIARMTVEIRNHQAAITQLHERPTGRKRNQARKHDLDVLISHRRKMLSYLRERDYQKFEWLLETLNIVYKPRPMENWESIERRKHQDRLTDLWCDELRTHRLQTFKQTLEKRQPEFLRRKAKLLRELLDEEIKHGESPSVSESEIDEILKNADSIELNCTNSDSSEKEYFIYEEKKVSDELHFMK